MGIAFVKGHGTGNDFLVLPDLDADLEPTTEQVISMCDRRRGLGADGILRVVRAADVTAETGRAEWFMDHRNADGSLSQMCGNGIRVFGRYLVEAGLVEAGLVGAGLVEGGLGDPDDALAVATRDGVKWLTFHDDGEIEVDMGPSSPGAETKVGVGGVVLPAVAVVVGNPNAVATVASVAAAGDLRTPPEIDVVHFPAGANVEFVERLGPAHLRMRVFERGVGETLSCGSGACAAVVAVQAPAVAGRGTPYTVDVPGGRLTVTWRSDGRVLLKGPAVLVAEGVWRG